MTDMHAAVVTDFAQPPQYATFPAPEPTDSHYAVEVLAAGLHPRVRSGAAGRHYSSTGRLPMIPGTDAVGRRDDGSLVYFIADDEVQGTMADRAEVDPRRAIDLPPGTDVATVAAAMNPAMSSWVALRRRIELQPGQSVLILGATGNAGAMAVQIARLLGAGQVAGAGRNRERLDACGADTLIGLSDDPATSAASIAAAVADVDVVIDYLWGPTSEATIPALLGARRDRAQRLDWIQIGAITGADITLPSAALRSADLRLMGSGQGSVSPAGYLAQLPSLVDALTSGQIPVTVRTEPLRAVSEVWTQPESPGVRTVLEP